MTISHAEIWFLVSDDLVAFAVMENGDRYITLPDRYISVPITGRDMTIRLGRNLIFRFPSQNSKEI